MAKPKRRSAKPKLAKPGLRATSRALVDVSASASSAALTALTPAASVDMDEPAVATAYQALAQMTEACALDGSQGTNRCRTRINQLGVETDVEAFFAWLDDRANNSPDTRRDFLSQGRRLFWWALKRCPNSTMLPHGRKQFTIGKALSSLTRQDLMTYKEFLKNPDQGAIGPRRPFLDRERNVNSEWRPFVGPLNAAHIEHVFLVLKNLFGYLVDVGYLDGNPLGGMRAKEKGSMGDHSKRAGKRIERNLDAEQWLAVLAAIERLPQGTDEEKHYYERASFMMQLFFHLGARIGEVASHSMEWFVMKPLATAGDNEEWVWSVMGKGGKEAEVPVNYALLAALARYRIFLNLPPLPHAGDKTPMLLDEKKKHGIGERQIARLVKEIFILAADKLKKTNPKKAALLRIASPHWIRHAGATMAVARAPDMKAMNAVRDFFRHSDLATTMQYVHVADEARKMVSEWLVQAAGLPAETESHPVEAG